ncbi:thioredoxin domain-containing protein [Agrococcus sp. Marseille-Q4369]|uniref:DsbA family protein n=1 Tax=Agrococcus sp. Marseille-Q4369 TaxID=2810513 RepID=UPI001B8B44A7|nr:thioredoxin domain-containing protein [Agrococcus sp. Marseille-Q4369]QUW19310.1 thioredoxin domain-containing protein [Agrococcus sp. Marseille-Q4369]
MPRSAAVSVAAVVGALVLIVAVALLVVRPWEAPTATPAPAPGASTASAELVDESTHLLSDAGAGAPVVVEFFDYECPACGQFAPIVDDLVERHGDEVTFAVRYFPLPSHENAIPAAVAAEAAAQQGAFAEMHALLLERQSDWAGADGAEETFRGYAEELGLDLAAFDEAVAADATLDRVALDANAGIALGVPSTPMFYVDGEQLQLRDFGDLEAAIEAALAE